jgi:ATP-dependent DNA ligase
MPLARLATPFDHPDFIFEPKMDGFRAVAYVEGGACRLFRLLFSCILLVSRKYV